MTLDLDAIKGEVASIRCRFTKTVRFLENGGSRSSLTQAEDDTLRMIGAIDALVAEVERLQVQAEIAFLEGWSACSQARQQPSAPQEAQAAWAASRPRKFVAAPEQAS